MPVNVLPNIWVGDLNDRKNNIFLNNNKIALIISLHSLNIQDKFTNIEIYISLVNDIKNYNINEYISHDDKIKVNKIILDHLFDITEFIHKEKRNKNIFIYCKDCNQITPTIIAAYMIRYAKIDHILSIKYLKTKIYNIFLPSPILISSLEIFCNKLKNI